MKTDTFIKKGKQTKIMADSIEEAKEIYNDSNVEDGYADFGDVYLREKYNRSTGKDEMLIDFPALGPINIEEAEKFLKNLQDAIKAAKEFNKKNI